MITIEQLDTRLKEYLIDLINTLATNNPIINFAKPIITRILNKNFTKVNKMLDLISEDGKIDIDNIITEMADNIINSKPFTFNTGFIGDILVGDGLIKLQLPIVNKSIVFNILDINKLKEALTKEL